ncbi:MAG: SDR family NAD(P)-dependent oxidoreductase [Rhodothermales bacterium]
MEQGMTVANRVIWVTGASSGIGKALCHVLSAKGARLVLSARNAEQLDAVRQSCAHPEQHLVLPLDLTQAEAFQEATDRVLQHFGHLDGLINNGGISQRSLAKDTALDVDRRIMEVNYFGAIGLTKTVLPHFLERGSGLFVAISSVSGHVGTPLRSTYAASKHAIRAFFDALRAEVSETQIQVLVACPGYVLTKISYNALTGDGTPQNALDQAQAEGLSAEACAEAIVAAIERGKAEVLIGGKETLAVYLKRFVPGLWRNMLPKLSTT